VKILPSSLYGRLLAILLVGLMVPQLLSALVHLYDRDSVLHQTMGAESAEKISSIVELLDSVEPVLRQSIVDALSGYPLEIVLYSSKEEGEHSLVHGDVPNEQLDRLFREYLQRRLPTGYEAYVEVVESERMVHDLGAMHPPPEMREMHQQMQQKMGERLSVKSFHVQIRLNDGVWVDFHYFMPKKIFAWPTRMVAALLLLMAAVLLLTWIAVRWVTRPLSTLSSAAEALGRDIHHPPLGVEGPTEVRQAALAFNTMQQRLSRYIGDRARILSAVSHDLKTPITRLRLRTELLEDQQLRGEIENDLSHMEEMVGATLDFMRGTERPELRQKIDLEALLESLQEDLHPLGILFEIQGELSMPVNAQLVSLKRCLTNLLENASHYGSGEVGVKLNESEQSVCVTVHNEGDPIPESELEKIFDPFYRIEHSRSRESGGTGLGLSIARNVAHAHGGELRIENAPQGGVSARLELPR
jgi:signal transduction histidine kinase